MTKLNWTYDDRSGEHRADYKGLLLRAVRDESPENPFDTWDCHWPMTVRSPDRSRHNFTDYDKIPTGPAPCDPMFRFTDGQLVHDQKAIAKAIGCDVNDYIEGDEEPKRWHTDADFLRDAFAQAIDELVEDSRALEFCSELYELLGIPALCNTSRGYCQGDEVEVLVVATPEAMKQFGCKEPPTPEQLQGQVDLYGAWAWGDVYGYIVMGPEDEDGEREEFDSCGGFYGTDFDKSGLEEAAIEAADGVPAQACTVRELEHV